jgi:hypothetical protein
MRRTNAQPADDNSAKAGNHVEPAEKVTLFPIEASIWKNTASFGADDLLLVAKVADLVHSKVVELRASDWQMKRPAQ